MAKWLMVLPPVLFAGLAGLLYTVPVYKSSPMRVAPVEK